MGDEEDEMGGLGCAAPSRSSATVNVVQLSDTEKLLLLTSLQVASGLFKKDPKIETVTGKSLVEIDAAGEKFQAEHSAWITAFVVAFIEEKFVADKDSWEMIVDKARAWLKASGHDANKLVQEAKIFILQ